MRHTGWDVGLMYTVRCYCMLVANHYVGVKLWQQNTWGVESVRSANVMGSRYLYTEGPGSCRGAVSNPAWPVCLIPLRLSNCRQITESHPKAYAAYVSQKLHSGFRIGFIVRMPPLDSWFITTPQLLRMGRQCETISLPKYLGYLGGSCS